MVVPMGREGGRVPWGILIVDSWGVGITKCGRVRGSDWKRDLFGCGGGGSRALWLRVSSA